jgi:phage I-like protein
MAAMYGHPHALRPEPPRPAVAVLAVAVSAAAGHLAQLTPDGTFRARDGRPAHLPGWKMSAAIAGRVLARLAARKTPIVVDYEHQTLLADQNGQPAPAAGWIDPAKVEYREGEGLFAPIDWTARAAAHIAAGEYKFLSPVLPFDPATGEVLDLMHVALTNYPGVDGMAPLAALRGRFDFDPQSPHKEVPPVDRTKLIQLLGLAADATDQQIDAAVAALKARADEAVAVRGVLAVTDAADTAAVTAAVTALKTKTAPDLSQYVPKAMYEETRAQLAALKAGADTAALDRLIEEGLADGRIAGQATADYLRGQGLAVLKAHLADAPSVAALQGKTQTGGKKPDGAGQDAGALTAAELAVCKGMGLTPEQYQAARA